MDRTKRILLISTVLLMTAMVLIRSGPVTASGIQALATLFVGTTPIVGGSSGDCLKILTGKLDSGACGGGGGGTIATTPNALKGDNAGNAIAVTGTGSNCVHVDGTSATCGGGGGSTFPLTIVQQGEYSAFGNVNNFVLPFPATTAVSGNTGFIIACIDGNSSVTLPVGWTVDINQVGATFARLVLLEKATAADVTATIVTSMSTPSQAWFFEVSGVHTLDTSALGTANNVQSVSPGAITPTAGAAAFAIACVTGSGSLGFVNTPVAADTSWTSFNIVGTTNGARQIIGEVLNAAAVNSSTTPPPIGFGYIQLFSTTSGIAFASFSLK